MKYILMIMLLLVAGTALAGDSGLYYDYDLNGEGLLMQVDGDRYVIYMFTYGEFKCDEKDPIPSPSVDDDDECSLNGQRWFFGTGTYDTLTTEVTGVLGITEGLKYPFGIRDPADPFRNLVGEVAEVGDYQLRREGDGWRMFVTQTTRELSKNDPLFDRVFEFTTNLFRVDEDDVSALE